MADSTRGLVLAGGGVTGIAWELGLLAALADAGVDVTGADLVVGTSAGAAVGAQVTSGTPLAELEAAQLAPPGESKEIAVELDIEAFRKEMAELIAGASGPDDARARVGHMALEAKTVPEEVRRAVIAARLPVHDWPTQRLLLTVVDAETGAWSALDATSGIDMVDAVAASCAVPGVWPPVTIGGRRYVDGGVRSLTNADLATGCDRVLVIVPLAMLDEQRTQLEDELAALGPGVAVLVVEADDASLAAIGPNPLDPAARAGVARAGRAQAGALVDRVGAFWQ